MVILWRRPEVTRSFSDRPKPELGEGPGASATKAFGAPPVSVDDNHDAANSLAMLLKLQGHEVRVAYSGPTAIEITNGFVPRKTVVALRKPDSTITSSSLRSCRRSKPFSPN
jgi:hypothetical protein